MNITVSTLVKQLTINIFTQELSDLKDQKFIE